MNLAVQTPEPADAASRQPRLAHFRNPDFLASAGLIFLGLLFFSDFLFTSKNFYFRDILDFHYPRRWMLIESFARGEFPLWNPALYLGQPLLANPNYLAFYPTNLLHALFSFNYAFKLHFVIHPVLAGLGMYFFQRRFGISALGCFGGAVAYEFSGAVLSFLNLYNIVPAVALMPWLAWAFLRTLDESRWSRIFVFAAILAVQVFAFEPLMIQCEALLLAGLAVAEIRAAADRRQVFFRVLRTGAAGGTLAACLSAVQVLPTLELLTRSARQGGFSVQDSSTWSTHPMDLLNLIVPNFFGSPFVIGYMKSWGESYHHGREPYLVSCFLGAGTIVLCLMSAFSSRKRPRLLFSVLGLAGLALALGRFSPVYRVLAATSHLFAVGRYPSKYMLLVTFCTSVLAAIGLEHLEKDALQRRSVRSLLPLATLAAGLCLLGLAFFWHSSPAALESLIRREVPVTMAATKDFPAITLQLADAVRAAGLFLSLCSAVVLAAPFVRTRAVVPGLLCGLIAVELLVSNLRLSPLMSEADVDYVPEVNAFLRDYVAKSEPVRVVPPTADLLQSATELRVQTPNASAAWLTLFYRRTGQPSFGIMNGIQYSLDRSVDYLNTAESESLWKSYTSVGPDARIALLRRLNSPLLLTVANAGTVPSSAVRSFDTQSNLRLDLQWIEGALPRVYLAAGVRRVSGPEQALALLTNPSFPVGTTVVLEDPAAPDAAPVPNPGAVKIIEYRNNGIVCEAEAAVPAYLVLLDSYYPGWKAYVDGAERPILRANYAFRAVPVQAGRHQVEFRYRPGTFYLGLSLSLISLFLGMCPLFRRTTRPSTFD